MKKQQKIIPIFLGFLISIIIILSIQISINQVNNKSIKRNNNIIFLIEKIANKHNEVYFWADKILFSPNAVSSKVSQSNLLIIKYMRILNTGAKINDMFDNIEPFQLTKAEVDIIDSLNLNLKRLNNQAKMLQQLRDEIVTTTSFLNNKTKIEFPSEFTYNLVKLSDYHTRILNLISKYRISLEDQNQKTYIKIIRINLTSIFIILLISGSIFLYIYYRIYVPLEFIKKITDEALTDKFRENIIIKSATLPEKIISNLKVLFHKFQNTNNIVRLISLGNENEINEEMLDKSLLKQSFSELLENLISIKREESKRREIDEVQNWISKGVVEISEVFKLNNDNIILLSEQIISKIVGYIDAVQGGIFIYDNDANKDYLNLVATYAYGRKRFIERKVKLGETLVGACALEKHNILLTKVPEEYYQVDSGLGNATPKSILLHPLIMENNLLGVIELASFNELSNKEIELIERVGANIAISLSNAQNNLKTIRLLEQSQLQTEKIQTREENLKNIITEREQYHNDYIKQENEFVEFSKAVNSAINTIRLSLNGEIIEFNKNATNLFDLSSDNNKIKSLIQLKKRKSDAAASALKESIQMILNGNQMRGENSYNSLKDEEIFVYEFWNPIKNQEGKIIEILIIMFDVTETKKHEVLLHEQTMEMKKQEQIMSQNLEEMMNLQNDWTEKEKDYQRQLEKANIKIKTLEKNQKNSNNG